ncbi:restriction endonuclease subunit S [Microbacterium sp. MPKO10]|uniref:restriction endonuclease subunit S n=1 Tax=Microbacterium sp. MPKO10 TaxID=2989818 RepID=UPI0022369039|nr:restriction endonuclease subunit S [Microbacterium sp. MPKO10]MCW4459756.1 restriction endonuclease subunit S [Microbacterium sp. MPKO10]
MTLSLDKSAWRRVAFGDVVLNVNETVRDFEAAGIDRVIAMEHMNPGELRISRWGSSADGTTFARRVKPGQTLFGKRRAYQRKVAYAEFDAICSGDIYTFEADESRILGEFLPFLVQSNEFFAHALGTSAGSLSPRTNWRDLAHFEFDLPPLDEQKRIADLLWTIEGAKQTAKSVATELMSLATATFEFAATSATPGRLADWVERIDAGRSPRASAEPAKGGELGVLKVSAVGHDTFKPGENKLLLNAAEFRAYDSIRAGDVLVTRANAIVDNVARPCLVDGDYPNLMLSDKTLRLVPKSGYPARVLLAALRSPGYRSYVREVVNGTEAKNISQAKILAGPVPTLSEDKIEQVTNALSALDAAISSVNSEARALTALTGSTLLDVFGGI